MVALVYGFPSQVAALQFEWAWQYPHLSRQMSRADAGPIIEEDPGTPKKSQRGSNTTTSASASKLKPAYSRRIPHLGIASQFRNLHKMLTVNAYRRWPLHIKVFNEEVWLLWEKQCGLHRGKTSRQPMPVPLPEWITAELDIMQVVPSEEVDSIGEAEQEEPASQSKRKSSANSKAKAKAKTTDQPAKVKTRGGMQNIDVLDVPLQKLATAQLEQLATKPPSCFVCKDPILLENAASQAHILVCPNCNAPGHLQCLSKTFLASEMTGQQNTAWLPTQGQCPSCRTPLNWASIVKAAAFRKQMKQAGAQTLAEVEEVFHNIVAEEEANLSESASDAGSVSSMTSAATQLSAIKSTRKKPRARASRSRSPSSGENELSMLVEEPDVPGSPTQRQLKRTPEKRLPVTDLSGLKPDEQPSSPAKLASKSSKNPARRKPRQTSSNDEGFLIVE